MATERSVCCDSASGKALPFTGREPLRLRLWDRHPNVHLTIGDIPQGLFRDPPPLLVDLLGLAMFVYSADQAVGRGNDTDDGFGANWRRTFHFAVPVSDPERWSDPAVRDALLDTLSFLTEDEYHFQFEALKSPRSPQSCLGFTTDRFVGSVEDVMLFSGGLDSLAGALQEAVVRRRKVVLVHHRSTEKIAPRHRGLLRALTEKARGAVPAHLAVHANKDRGMTQDRNQRARSFLYTALAATVAGALGLRRVLVWENGIVSLNLPPCAQVVGSRASRTTHPRVLAGLSRLLGAVTGRPFPVENHFRTKTKTDVIRLIADAGCADLIPYTRSCASTMKASNAHPHCGVCSQCIDRRFAVLAAQQERNDPASCYRVDLLTGDWPEGQPRTMLASYTEMCSQIAQMTPAQFFRRYGEVSRVLRHLDGPPDVAAHQVFTLYQKHAREVTGVIDAAIGRSATGFRLRTLAPTCLLRMVCDLGDADPGAAPSPPEPLPENMFRRRGETWEVRFAGRRPFTLLPSKGAAYLHRLLQRPGVPLSSMDLCLAVTGQQERIALGAEEEAVPEDVLLAYRGRAEELAQLLGEARRNDDLGGQEKYQEEINGLLAELRKNEGLRSPRRDPSSPQERVRKAVGNDIRRAVQKIARYDEELAAHLSPPRLNCGRQPCYSPSSDITWVTETATN